MIREVSFYDFDGTLIDTPKPEEGRVFWKEKTGEEYPHIGWWGRKESLSQEVFDIKPFPAVVNQLKRDATKSDTYTVLLTARLEKLRPEVESILENNGLLQYFDEVSLKNGSAEKDGRIKEIIKKFSDLNVINLYDDRDKEMKVFSSLKNEIGNDYLINIYRVTDGDIALFESSNYLKKMIIDELSIYI